MRWTTEGYHAMSFLRPGLRHSPWIVTTEGKPVIICEYCTHPHVPKNTMQQHEPQCPWLQAWLDARQGDTHEGIYDQWTHYHDTRSRLLQEGT